MSRSSIKTDYLAGSLMILIGLGATAESYTRELGTLTSMGSGFFPFCLGILLTLLGVAIAGAAVRAPVHHDRTEVVAPTLGHEGYQGAEWRGWSCIIGGVAAFIAFGAYGGLLPATFACVFISALGDRGGSPLSALVLASCVTAVGIFLFWYVLQVQFPLLRWGLA